MRNFLKHIFAYSKLTVGIVALSLSVPVMAADHPVGNFDQAIKCATTSGQFRFGYIAHDPDVAASSSTSGAAVGGQIKFETAAWNRLQFAIAPYFSEKLDALSGDKASGKLNGDFFDSNKDSFAYLGEAYVNYAWLKGTARLGRQLIDTPFINTDDIRMLPNTFDAFWVKTVISDNLALEAGKVSKMAGFDSTGSQDKFTRASNDGVLAIGATYKMQDHHSFQAWYYDFDKAYSQFYLEAIYANGEFEAGMQYTDYSEDNASGTEGTVWGLSAAYDFGVIKGSVAINEGSNATGKSASNGLGGGGFFTSMDEITIAGINDASAYAIYVEYPATDALSLTAAFAHFKDGSKTTHNLHELNLIVSYQVNKSMDVSFTHTTVDNSAAANDAGTNFTRQLLIANYNF